MEIFEQLRPLLKSIDPEISQLWNDYGQEIQRIKIVSNEEELLSVLSAYICLIGELQIKGKYQDTIFYIDKALFLLDINYDILETSIYNKWYEYLIVVKISSLIYAKNRYLAFKTAKMLINKYPKSRYTGFYWTTLFNLPVMWILPIGIFLISFFPLLNFSSSDYISLIHFFSLFIFAYLYISTRKFIYLIYFIIILSLYLIPIF